MEKINCLTKVEYANKGRIESFSDFLLTPLSYALNGRTVRCLDRQTWDKATKNHHNNIEFIISRKESGFLHVIKRICAMAIAIILFPASVVGLIGKGCSRSKELAARFAERRENDKVSYEDRSSKGFIASIAASIGKEMKYDSTKQGAHILADKEMGARQPFADQQGGLFMISAKLLREQLEEYREMCVFGDAENEALKIAREYEQWSHRMLGVMPLHYVNFNNADMVDKVALDLQERLSSMTEGETFLVPVNLRIGGAFHTITVGFQKKDDGSYSLTVYNCGAGSRNHPDVLFNKVLPFQIDSISQDKITDLQFLKAFVNQATFKTPSDTECSQFYGFLRNHSWNENAVVNAYENRTSETTDQEARTIMRSGSCIWRSPLTAFKHIMPHDNYKQFIFAMKVNETDRVAKTAKKSKKNSRERQLAQIGLQKCENWERTKLDAPLPEGLKGKLDDKLAAARQRLL